MRFARSRLGLAVAGALLLPVALVVHPALAQEPQADEPEEESSGFFDQLIGAAREAVDEAVEEKIEEVTGEKPARLSSFERVELRGNLLQAQATYEGIQEGRFLLGVEVLRDGFVLDGFTLLHTSLEPGEGIVRLQVEYAPDAQSDPWGLSANETESSDQLRLYLLREAEPETRLGELIVDLSKQWTTSSDLEWPVPDEGTPVIGVADVESEETIVLADDEVAETEPAAGVETAEPAPARTQPQTSADLEIAPLISKQRLQSAAILPMQAPPVVRSYSFFKYAGQAQWSSAAGPLAFPSGAAGGNGSVKALSSARLSTGNEAVKLLVTQPQPRRSGWIKGSYPEMTLGPNLRFKAVAGFLEGSRLSDGATFNLWVFQGKRGKHLLRKQVTPQQYVSLDVDLSAWAGKTVSFALTVLAGPDGRDDWAVWVLPRLVEEN